MKAFPFAIWPNSIRKSALTELEDMRGGVEKVTGQNLGGTPEKIGKIGDSIYPKIPASDTPTPATRVLRTLNDIHTRIAKQNEGKGWNFDELSKDPGVPSFTSDFQTKYALWPRHTADTLAAQMFLERRPNDPNAALGVSSMLRSTSITPTRTIAQYNKPDIYPRFPSAEIENAFNHEVFSPLGLKGYHDAYVRDTSFAGATPEGAIYARKKRGSVPDLIAAASKLNDNEGGEIFYHGVNPSRWDGSSVFNPDPRFLAAQNLGNSLYASRSDAIAGLYANMDKTSEIIGQEPGAVFAFRTPKDFKWFDFTEKFGQDHEIHAGINEFLSRLAKIHGVEHVPWAPTTKEFWSNAKEKRIKNFTLGLLEELTEQKKQRQEYDSKDENSYENSLSKYLSYYVNKSKTDAERSNMGSEGTLSGNDLLKLFDDHLYQHFKTIENPLTGTEPNNRQGWGYQTITSQIFHNLMAALGYDGSKENPLDSIKPNPGNQEVSIYPSSLHKLEHLGQHQGDWSEPFHEPITLEKLIALRGQTGNAETILRTLLGNNPNYVLFNGGHNNFSESFPLFFPKSDGTYGRAQRVSHIKDGETFFSPLTQIFRAAPEWHPPNDAYQEFIKTLPEKEASAAPSDIDTLSEKMLPILRDVNANRTNRSEEHNSTLSVLQKFLNFFAHNKRRTDIPIIEPSWRSPQAKSFAATRYNFRKNYYLMAPFPFSIYPEFLHTNKGILK